MIEFLTVVNNVMLLLYQSFKNLFGIIYKRIQHLSLSTCVDSMAYKTSRQVSKRFLGAKRLIKGCLPFNQKNKEFNTPNQHSNFTYILNEPVLLGGTRQWSEEFVAPPVLPETGDGFELENKKQKHDTISNHQACPCYQLTHAL